MTLIEILCVVGGNAGLVAIFAAGFFAENVRIADEHKLGIGGAF
jgi:hypothetical protein